MTKQKFVINGKATCPYFKRACAIADQLQQVNHDVEIEKVSRPNPEEWEILLRKLNSVNRWSWHTSPCVYEVTHHHMKTKKELIGGSSNFARLVNKRFEVDMRNEEEKKKDEEEEAEENEKSEHHHVL
eukprot:m.337276 g.337276  ORF g.337276 m.337276 type:complete len:128 (+) comp18090_c0_seq1:178-561(+)